MVESGKDLYDSNMSPLARPIQHYGLYGEADNHPDVVHCETIAERSQLHDWELSPHRHDRLHQVLLLRGGGGTARLDDSDVALGPGALVNVPRGAVHAFSFRPGTDGMVVTLADTLLEHAQGRDQDLLRVLRRPFVAEADRAVDEAIGLLAREHARGGTGSSLVLRGLSSAVLGMVARFGLAMAATASNLHESHLLARFDALLEQHFRAHWRVVDYANALAVSPTHLSRVVRARTGLPASRQIDARLVREARRLLAFTPLRISSISHSLGFSDPALFSRVFQRVAGCPPRAFRQRLALGAPPDTRPPGPGSGP